MLTENDIADISRRIVAAVAPLVVGTFGSYAIGAASERSDLDLLLIVNRSHATPERRARHVHAALFGVLHPLDIHSFMPEEFEETAYEWLSFTWVIAQQARIYHWSESAARQVPSLRLRASYRPEAWNESASLRHVTGVRVQQHSKSLGVMRSGKPAA